MVIDNITNNIRGNWRNAADSPDQVVDKVAKLRERILSLSAAAVVVCEAKPMQMIDVRPYNWRIHEYLKTCGNDGFGCRTQIQMNSLSSDGYHIDPRYHTVLDRTYAYALIGLHVPNPAPEDAFIPELLRRRMDSHWPRLVGKARAWNTG